MDWIGIIIQLILGAVGGHAGVAVVKNSSLGSTGNTIVGAVGGIVLGQILQGMMGGAGVPPADPAATAEAARNVGAYVRDVIGGGVGGAILTVVAGLIKNSMSKA